MSEQQDSGSVEGAGRAVMPGSKEWVERMNAGAGFFAQVSPVLQRSFQKTFQLECNLMSMQGDAEGMPFVILVGFGSGAMDLATYLANKKNEMDVTGEMNL